MKIIEVIDKIRNFHGALEHTRFDKVLYGDTEKECTGIVTTCAATADVIRKAHELGANLIVCHEPAFYTGSDEAEKIEGVALVEEKKKLLDETGITIWRDHDHMHGGGPGGKPDFSKGAPKVPRPREKTDYIFYGIMKVLGWEDYLIGDPKKPLYYEIPETDVTALSHFLMERLNLTGVRIVGDRNAKVRRVFITEHVNEHGDEALYTRPEVLAADVFIPLEIIDWTFSYYIRDAVQMGQHKAIIEMGHFNFEEPGMRWMAEDWLPKLLDNALPVTFVQSGDAFSYIAR